MIDLISTLIHFASHTELFVNIIGYEFFFLSFFLFRKNLATINVDRSLLICDQAVLLPPFSTPILSSVLLPVWTVIVRSIAIIKDRDKRKKEEKDKLLPL